MTEERLIRVGVAGLGNCGGQMADLAASVGLSAIAINASKKDLDLLKNNVTMFPIGDGKGTGKNRDEAREFFKNHCTLLKDESFIKFIMDNDVTVIAASTGGGFGSGASLALTKLLYEIYPDKLFIPAGVLPFDDEGYTAQSHTVEWLRELRLINAPEDSYEIDEDGEVKFINDEDEKMHIAYMLYDNNRFANKSQKQVCEIVNRQFVNDLRVMSGDFVNPTRTGGTDERDFMTCLSTPGRVIIDSFDEIEESDIVSDSIMMTLKNHIKKESAHAEMAEDKEIWASVTMYTLDDNFDNYKPTIKADLQSIFGSHLSDFSNFADDVEDHCSLALIISGLSDPTLRIDRVVNRRNKLESDILDRKKAVSKLNSSSSGNTKLKLGAKSFAGEKVSPAKNTDDILSKFMKDN